MKLTIDRSSPVPMYRQIVEQIRLLIIEGELEKGSVLPSERKLAELLDINRSTVLSAYQELKAEGLVRSIVGKGTVVLGSDEAAAAVKYRPVPWRQLTSTRISQFDFHLIQDLMRRDDGHKPEHISFAVGNPPAECIPLQQLNSIQHELMEASDNDWFRHCPTEGFYPLRHSAWMKHRGIHNHHTEDVLIVSGAQQGLDLLARTFIEPGDVVFVEDPSYFSAMRVFQMYGAKLVAMPNSQEGGLNIGLIDAMLLRYRPKFIYVLPTFQNPSGRVIGLEQRKQLMELAVRYQTFIIEEDPYFDLRYEGDPVATFKSMDEQGIVMYLSTFSKILSPGLRVGWLSVPAGAAQILIRVKQMMDLHTNHMAQVLIDRYCRMGLLSEHIESLLTVYSRKRNFMVQALRAHEHFSFSVPEGGLFLWVRLPGNVHPQELMILAGERGVHFLPGEYFYASPSEDKYIRLNFSAPSIKQIGKGISILSDAVALLAESENSKRMKRGEFTPFV